LAYIYSQSGRYAEALPLSEKAYSLRKKVRGEKHPETLTSLTSLAYIYSQLGRYAEALPLYEKAYSLRTEMLGEKHSETLTNLSSLAYIYSQLGRYAEALPLYEKAYSLIHEVRGEKHSETLSSLSRLAYIYSRLGRYAEALPLSEKAYSLIQEVLGEKHPETLTSLSSLASIYSQLGRYAEALPLSKNAYSLRKKVRGEKHLDTLTSLSSLAYIYSELGRYAEALPLYEKAYSIRTEVLGEKHQDTLSSLSSLAYIYSHHLGRYAEALPLSEKAYSLIKEVLGEKHPETLTSLGNLAAIYSELGRYAEALPLYEKAYSIRTEVLGEKHQDTLSSLNNLAVLTENPQKSIQLLEKFVSGVENLRSSDLSAENRQALFKKWVPGYFRLSRLYMIQARLQDAFRLAEMSKARTLLESLTAKLATQQSGLTSLEQQKLQDYDARLAFLNNRIAKALDENRLEEKITLETEKNQLVNQLNDFDRELMAKYPKYAQLNKVQFVGAKEGTKYLPKDAVLISYLINENHVLAFTLQADGTLTAHNLGKIPNLQENLEKYRKRLPRSKNEKPTLPGAPIRFNENISLILGEQLLAPLKDIIEDKSHWIISPSGALALIPFETLRLEGEEQPVIAQHQISYVQSLSVLAMLQKRDTVYKSLKNRGTLLAMGAPLYTGVGTAKDKGNPTDFKIADQMVMRGGDYVRAFRQIGRDKWKNLEGAFTELSQLEDLFKETKPRIYKQAEATEAKLQTLNQQGILAQHRYLVFSAHGYLSPQVPTLSSIVLGQVNNPPGVDGYVTAGEWPSYDLKSDLMVLSACQTGVGEIVSGEGVMGLPYAFYVAGNKNTILTLWSISDEVTVEFITSFFTKLKAGVGQIEALTATKREFLAKGGRYANPKYWAAFVLYGV
jgi:CHAT domain-containing protein